MSPCCSIRCISYVTMDEYKGLELTLAWMKTPKATALLYKGDTDPDRYKNIVWKGLDK